MPNRRQHNIAYICCNTPHGPRQAMDHVAFYSMGNTTWTWTRNDPEIKCKDEKINSNFGWIYCKTLNIWHHMSINMQFFKKNFNAHTESLSKFVD